MLAFPALIRLLWINDWIASNLRSTEHFCGTFLILIGWISYWISIAIGIPNSYRYNINIGKSNWKSKRVTIVRYQCLPSNFFPLDWIWLKIYADRSVVRHLGYALKCMRLWRFKCSRLWQFKRVKCSPIIRVCGVLHIKRLRDFLIIKNGFNQSINSVWIRLRSDSF